MTHPFYVDPDIPPALEAITRFQSIKRWHMIDTARPQSIAEHSANVALLVYYIAVTSPGAYFGPAESTIAPALLHDIEESFIGDIPTHTKRMLRGVSELEEQIVPVEFKVGAPKELRLLIKLCDLADGIRFVRIHGCDKTAIWAMHGLEDQFKAKRDIAKEQWPHEVSHHALDHIFTYAWS